MNKEDLIETLESELNHYKYSQIKCGSLLAHFFFLNIYKNPEQLSNKAITVNSILICIKLFINSIIRRPKSINVADKIIITKVSNNEHINKLMTPIIEHWAKSSIVVTNGNKVADHKQIEQKLLLNISIKDILSVSFYWIIFFYRLINITIKYKLSLGFLIQAGCQIYVQLIRVAYWDNIIKNTHPDAIITEYDRYNFVIPIILIARKYKISTITLTHGAISSKLGFTPLLAEYILVWGETQQNILLENKIEITKIKIVGCPIVSPQEKTKNKEVLMRDMGLDTNKKTLTLIINPIGDEYNSQLIELFYNSLSRRKNIQGIIKLHPSQNKNKLIHLILKFPQLIWIESKEIKNSDLFSVTDFLFSHNSGMGVEALFNDVPVAIFNNIDASLGIGRELIEHANCPEIKQVSDLEDLLEKIEKDIKLYKQTILSDAAPYIKKIYFKTGKEASEETIKVLNKLIYEK